MTATVTLPASPAAWTAHARLEVWDPANTGHLADVEITGSANGRIPHSELGALTATVGADTDAAEALRTIGNHVRLYLGDELVHTWLIEPESVSEQIVALDDADLTLTLELRSHAADLARAVAMPAGGWESLPRSSTRPFTWASLEVDTGLDPWVDAVVLHPNLSVPWAVPQTDPPWFSPWLPPRGMPDNGASWLAPAEPDEITGHPVGRWGIVDDITIPTSDLYALFVAADDAVTPYVDGIRVGDPVQKPNDQFIVPWVGCWLMSAGTHRIGLAVENFERPDTPLVGTFGGPNITRVAWTVIRLPDGANTVLAPELVVANSGSGTARCIPFGVDPWPAPRHPHIARVLLEENQAEGRVPGWTVDAADLVMSDLTQADNPGDQFLAVGDDSVLSWLRTAHSAASLDWLPDPAGKVLRLWNFGGLGDPAHPATYTGGGGGLTSLRRSPVPVVNAYVVNHRDGSTFVRDDAAIEELGVEIPGTLNLQTLDGPTAVAKARRILQVRSRQRASWEAAVEVDPTGALAPYSAAGGPHVGDAPLWAGRRLRLEQLDVGFEGDGWPTFRPTLETREASQAELLDVMVDKLRGSTREATPLEGMNRGISAGEVQQVPDLDFTMNVPSVGGDYSISRVKRYPEATRVWSLDLTQVRANHTNPTTVNLLRNGDVVAAVTLPVGFYHATALCWWVHFTDLDALQVECVDCDPPGATTSDDVRWLGLSIRGVKANPGQVNPRSVDTPW